MTENAMIKAVMMKDLKNLVLPHMLGKWIYFCELLFS